MTSFTEAVRLVKLVFYTMGGTWIERLTFRL